MESLSQLVLNHDQDCPVERPRARQLERVRAEAHIEEQQEHDSGQVSPGRLSGEHQLFTAAAASPSTHQLANARRLR